MSISHQLTELADVIMIEPRVFRDERGHFFESWNAKDYNRIGINQQFVQENQSLSHGGVLRGLHFQSRNTQGKLVWVAHGEVFDVAVDLRVKSPTFGRWQGFSLSSFNNRRLWIPEGFAHGFLTLSEQAVFCYKCTNYYDPSAEVTLAWNDPLLGITWPGESSQQFVISKKDRTGLSFQDCANYF